MDEVPVKIMDKDWVALIIEAKTIGLTKEEIQTFLETSSREQLQK